MASSVTPSERPRGRGAQQVFKSGPLYISSKGLGWKSWKRRWFVLTRTSLVFFKSDPNVASQKNELNLALGGIDLNNSGSVLVRADKKLLTVLFPDGRAFTLKAETSEDLNEWKASLEKALSTAPNAGLVMGQNGIFRNDSIDAGEGPVAEIGREKRPVKSLVVGRPILLALEDIDGSPSFLEKALCYIEQYGVKVEGILRQSADVDDVERRIRDFEQGKSEFGPEEDAHIVGDCIKHVLRELPSSPVPTPCCTALLEAYRIDGKGARIASMRIAVSETFPEPNRRLLQRLLKMMRTVAAHTAENRMTSSAVAACMAPLLLRPLLAGECGLEDDSDVSGDNSAQLLAAATAANNAQAIITLLMEEYDCIFDQEEVQPTPASLAVYPQNEDSASDGSLDEEVLQMHDNGYHDARNDADPELDEDADCVLSCTLSESSGNDGSDIYDYKDVQVFEGGDSENESPERFNKGFTQSVNLGSSGKRGSAALLANESFLTTSLDMGRSPWCDVNSPLVSPKTGMSGFGRGAVVGKADPKSQSSASSVKRTPLWGRPSATKKNVSSDAMDSSEEELAIQRLEAMRNELRNKIAREAKGNAALQASLERRKQALHERRFTLEQDVTRLQEQLQAERDLRAALEIGLSMSSSQFLMTQSFDLKTRAELEEIARAEADVARLKQKVAELHMQLNGQRQHQHCSTVSETNDRFHWAKNLQAQQKVLQQELDVTLALCHHEKQKNHETDIRKGQGHSSTLADHHQRNALIEAKDVPKAEKARGIDMRRRNTQDLSGVGWRALRPPTGPSAGGRQFAWKQRPDSSINMDPRQTDATMSYSTNDCTSVSDMVAHNSAKRSYMDVEASNPAMSMYPRQSAASLALVELTTRLDFFKERRSQLMEQLHNLDLTISPTSVDGHDLVYSSPPWNHQS